MMTSEPNLMILVLCMKSFCTGQQISHWSCHMHLVRRWMLLELPQVNCCRNTKWNAFINAGWATDRLYFPILKFQFLLTEDNTRVNLMSLLALLGGCPQLKRSAYGKRVWTQKASTQTSRARKCATIWCKSTYYFCSSSWSYLCKRGVSICICAIDLQFLNINHIQELQKIAHLWHPSLQSLLSPFTDWVRCKPNFHGSF